MDTPSIMWIKEIKIELDSCKGCKSCVNACFADGSARFIINEIDRATWHAFWTIAGGEIVSEDTL